jgi:NifB/MoaA-like Fe-S oxidoreductase
VIRRRLLRNPRAPEIVPLLRLLAEGGIRFHTQIVLQPGVNDGAVLDRSLEDLYALGEAILSVSVVPVGLTEFSKHGRVREPTTDECAAAIASVRRMAQRAVRERGRRWAYGADDLYLAGGVPLPPAEAYDDFEQVENGVGSVRYLESRIRAARGELPNLSGVRVGVVTGTAMARLMPRVLERLEEATGGRFETIVVVNDLFGPSVTTAGLLPGRAIQRALQNRGDLGLALLPAEAVNDRGLLLDNVSADAVSATAPMRVRFSLDFADVLAEHVPA